MRSHLGLTQMFRILPVMVCLCLVPSDVRLQDEPASNGTPVPLNKCWETETAEPVSGMIAADSERIYVPVSGGGIQAINVKDGRNAWSAELGGELGSRVLVNGRALYAVSLTGGPAAVLRSISKQTGITNWSESLPASDKFFLGEAAGGLVVVSENGNIEFRSADNGSVLWRKTIASPVTAEPFFTDGRILVGSGQKVLYMISSADGRSIARKSLKFVPTAISSTIDDRIIVGDERGNLALRDAGGDVQWNFKNGARISNITYTKHGILAVSLDNFVYLLSNRSGSVVWKRRLPGRVFGRPAIDGDTFVATTVADGRAFVMDIESGKLINQAAIDSSDAGGLQPLLIGEHSVVFSLPSEVRLYSSQGCS